MTKRAKKHKRVHRTSTETTSGKPLASQKTTGDLEHVGIDLFAEAVGMFGLGFWTAEQMQRIMDRGAQIAMNTDDHKAWKAVLKIAQENAKLFIESEKLRNPVPKEYHHKHGHVVIDERQSLDDEDDARINEIASEVGLPEAD